MVTEGISMDMSCKPIDHESGNERLKFDEETIDMVGGAGKDTTTLTFMKREQHQDMAGPSGRKTVPAAAGGTPV